MLLIYLASVAAMRGLADVYANVMDEHLSTWKTADQVIDSASWRDVADIADSALTLTPNNPDLLITAGYIQELKPTLNKTERQDALLSTIAYYTRATKLRPVWPNGWRHLAGAKYQADQIDPMFQNAFRNAIDLGTWDPDILFGMSELGYAAWHKLTATNRAHALDNNRRALERDPKQLYKVAKRQNQTYLYCYVVADDEKALRNCVAK